MAINDSDLMLIQSQVLGTTEKITFQQFREQTVLNDDDRLLLNDGSVTSTVTWGEMKGELVPPLEGQATVTPVAPTTTDTLTCTVLATGGVAPYTYAYQWYNKYGVIYNWQPLSGATESTLALSDDNLGRNFRCQVTITDSTGTESVVTSNETQSVEPGVIAPVINSVSLTEQNPHADPRFTSQSFDAAVSMTDNGTPGSVKSISAYVKGTITETQKFDEPLESSNVNTVDYSTGWSLNVTNGASVVGKPENMFGGGNYGGQGPYQGSSTYTFQFSGTPKDWQQGPKTVGVAVTSNQFASGISIHINANIGNPTATLSTVSNTVKYLVFDIPDGQTLTTITVAVSAGGGTWPSGQIGAFWALPDGSTSADDFTDDRLLLNGSNTNLVFATGTDMSALEAGDEVAQTSEYTARAWSDDVSEQGGTGPQNVEKMFDGDLNTFAQSFNYNANIMWDTAAYPLTGKLKGYVGLTNGTYVVLYKDKNNNNTTKNFPGSAGSFELDVEELTYIQVKYQDFQNYTQIKGIELDGALIINDQAIATGVAGTVASIADVTLTLTEEVGGWETGVNVTGPEKTVVIQDATKYLAFDTNGAVTELLDAPQDPPYTDAAANPTLTLTFPATFPSGNTPDQELGEGTTLTVEAIAANAAGSSGPVNALVQPDNIPPTVQFREPLESSAAGEIAARTFHTDLFNPTNPGAGSGGINNPEQMFDANLGNGAASQTNNGTIAWDTSAYPLTGSLEFGTYGGGNGDIEIRDADGTRTESVTAPDQKFTVTANAMTYFSYKYTNSNAPSLLKYCKVDGVLMQDNQAVPLNSTDLVFASDADMEPLAAGDVVQQGIGVILDSRIANPRNIVDGDLTTYGSLSSGLYSIILDLVTPLPTGDVENSIYLKYSTSSSITCVVSIYDQNNDRIGADQTIDGTNGAAFSKNFTNADFKNKLVKRITFYPQNQTANVWGVRIGGVLIDAGTAGTVGSINGTTVSLTEKVDGWVNGEDVVGPDKTPTRSMTEQEYVEQLVKFSTYENRRDVHEGEIAMGKRDEMVRQLEAAGVDPPAIRKILGGTSK